MRVKFILPALTEATSPFFRPINYALFPPLGLATLAASRATHCPCSARSRLRMFRDAKRSPAPAMAPRSRMPARTQSA